jgi:hypothetical protein
LKDNSPRNGVEGIVTSICSTTQLGWMFKKFECHEALPYTLDYYAKLMKQQMNKRHIMKLHA